MDKLKQIFSEKGIVVRKGLDIGKLSRLPNAVVETLYETLESNDHAVKVEQIESIVQHCCFSSAQKELVKSIVRERGEATLLDRLVCNFDEQRDNYFGRLQCLPELDLRVEQPIINTYGKYLLTTTGLWGSARLTYEDMKFKNKYYPYNVLEFVPLQTTDMSLDEFCVRRKEFDTNEWIDILMATMGLSTTTMTTEQKMVHLLRLVPYVEENVNLIELGPCSTGKTFLFQNISPHGFVITGSQTTVAALFYNKLKNEVGPIGTRDVVVFDEVCAVDNWGDPQLFNMLKCYMNDKQFSRGHAEVKSSCSLYFVGNVDCDTKTNSLSPRVRNLFSKFPETINRDVAFFDRINGIVPGWKLSPLSANSFASGYGFSSNYFSGVMQQMRSVDVSRHFDGIDFGNMPQRTKKSIMKIACGLLKLIYPDRLKAERSSDGIQVLLEIGLSCRKLLIEQLASISPNEFRSMDFTYRKET